LINPSSEATQKFSIDGHTFTVIANDFTPVVPYETNLITLAIAQRTDIIVEAVGTAGDSYWMRSQLGTGPNGCSLPDGVSPNGMAVVYYNDADPDTVPTTSSEITDDQIYNCNNDPLNETSPLYPIPVSTPADLQTLTLHFDFGVNASGKFIWTVNNSSARVDYGISSLLEAQEGSLDPEPEW
jgi:FtsP/CotA-like multicopper oxidase with cupredoxin domain